MQKRVLFQQLCAVANTIEAACAQMDAAPATRALEAMVQRLDALIGTLLDDGVQDDAPAPVPLSLAQWRARDREEEGMHAPERLLARIQACADAALHHQPPLPCRVDAMAPREYQIYLALSAALGALTTVADWTRAARQQPQRRRPPHG